MICMTLDTFRPENRTAAVGRFVATGGAPPAGLKLLLRQPPQAGWRAPASLARQT